MTLRSPRSTNLHIVKAVALFVAGPRTKQEIATTLRIQENTAGRMVNALFAHKLIAPVSRSDRTGRTGPWPILFGWVAK